MAPRACCRCSRGSSPHKGAWHGGARRTLRGAIGDRGHLAAPRHCHVALNVRGGTFTPEWQCAVHCHSVSIVPQRYAQGRVAVQHTLPLGGERAGRYVTHCHSVANVRGGTFTHGWQCASDRPAKSGEASPRGREGFSADQAGLFRTPLRLGAWPRRPPAVRCGGNVLV